MRPSGRRLVGPVVVVLGGLLLAACSGPGNASSPEPDADASPSATSGTATDGEWDPHTWVPTVTITPVAMTEAEKVAWRTQWLADTAEQAGLQDPPQVALVRWTEGNADHDEATAGCLTDAGFTASVGSDRGVDLDVPEAQVDAFQLAMYVCESKYTLDPVYYQEWTTDQLNLIFDYWTQFYLPCLQAHGVPVDLGAVPSKAAWVAAFHTSRRLDWWPDTVLQTTPASIGRPAREACSMYPPDDVFYGQ
ncbi:MAG: hypothetical protein KQH57_17565 [Actinomycetales bacterium]|nr:hypothetical protein [Actinomycetales bacterium]